MYEDIYNQIMQKVDGLVAEDRIDQAVDILDRAVYGFVERKDYWHAKDCYNKLMEVNPLALSEIIRVADFIERSVFDNISVDHKAAWKEFYKDLPREIAVAFYLGLEEIILKPEDVLYKQRDLNDKLFLIDSGSIGLYAETKFDKIRLATLKPGELVGIEGFLYNTYCSNTAQAENPTVLRALKLADFEKWPTNFNHLSIKINFMAEKQQERVSEIIKKTAIQRRRYERYAPNNRVYVEMNFPDFNKKFRAELLNVSFGGVAALGRIDTEMFRNVLGAVTELSFVTKKQNFESVFNKSFVAEVVGAVPKYNHNYSIHLQFKDLLESDELNTLINRVAI